MKTNSVATCKPRQMQSSSVESLAELHCGSSLGLMAGFIGAPLRQNTAHLNSLLVPYWYFICCKRSPARECAGRHQSGELVA